MTRGKLPARRPHRLPTTRGLRCPTRRRSKADALIRETYKNELEADDKAAAARSLIAAVDKTTVPAEKAALLLTAAEVAAAAGEFALAFDAYDELTRQFAFDGLEAKVKAVEDAAKIARTSGDRVGAAHAALELLEEAARDEYFDLAERAGKAAQAASLRTRDTRLRKEVAARRARLEKEHKLHDAREKVFSEARWKCLAETVANQQCAAPLE